MKHILSTDFLSYTCLLDYLRAANLNEYNLDIIGKCNELLRNPQKHSKKK